MVTGEPMRMTTDALHAQGLLTLAQWFSPAFPIGAFSFSHGLEHLVDTGDITDVAQFREWVEYILRYGAGHNDTLLMSAAYRAETDAGLAAIDLRARALAPSGERLLETVEQGRSFARTLNGVWGTGLPDLCYPVAVGAAARACGLPLAATASMYLHALLSSLTSAAIRLVPLGQTAGQKCIFDLLPLCGELAGHVDQPLEALGSSTFLADIASMKHETQYSRIFRT